MDMSMSSTIMDMPSHTADYQPGYTDSKGVYVPTDDEVTAYQAARIPWADHVKYGYWALYLLAGLLVLFTIISLLWRYRLRSKSGSKVYNKAAAASRAMTYPQLKPSRALSLMWTFGPLGPNILIFIGLLFSSCVTWIAKYYYYAPFYGSAPLFLRSEWIAMATLPFLVYALSRNLGISADEQCSRIEA